MLEKRLLIVVLSLTLPAMVARAGSTVTYTYTDTGQVASFDGPRTDVSDVTYYTYDSSGHLVTVTNALGHVTTFSNFDTRGNPQTLTDPNGIVTTLTYTPQGFLASSTIEGAVTLLSYNAVGDVTKITAVDGSFLSFTYDDARRLIAITNTLGETQTFTLDAMGNQTSAQLKDTSGTLVRQQQRTYDELGRLLTQVGASGQTVRYAYNLNDQRTQTADPLNHITGQAFDALGRMMQITDPLGGITALTYNPNDQLEQLVDPRGVTTQYTYDALGRLTSVVSPDSGTATYLYDNADNIIQRTDARGVVTNYQYDALNRLVSQHYPTAPILDTVYTYDQSASNNKGIGRLTSLTDSAGTVTYRYDSRGQLVAQDRTFNLAGLSSPLSFNYDTSGRLVGQDYPEGVSIAYGRNSEGQISTISLSVGGQTFPVASNIVYAPFGPLKQLTWGSGITLNRTYDQDYQLTAQTVGDWQIAYSFDPAGNIATQQNNLWESVQYQYDALNRLTREQSESLQKDYLLDATGNRRQRTTTDRSTGNIIETQQLTTATDSNRLIAQDGTPLQYDASGNLLQNATGLRYTYDAHGRLNSVYQAGMQKVADYTYNALGQRVLKLTYDPASGALQGGSVYSYGANGEVIGQSDYSATSEHLSSRYWVWLDGVPLAQAELTYTQGAISGGRIIYLHSDHLNTPRLATSTQGVVWSWISDAYGATLPNEDVDGDGVETHIPLRFPGQIYDVQTQLNYNYYRDYDPNMGRYVQSDPIGLWGGLNTYGYVNANPVNFADPYGLAVGFDDSPGNGELEKAYAVIRDTKHGGAICRQLEESSNYYLITTNGANGSAWYDGKNRAIRIDPNFSPVTKTTKGNQLANTATIMAHEVGHAATKIWDDGVNQMNNVNANENPVRRELGLPERTGY